MKLDELPDVILERVANEVHLTCYSASEEATFIRLAGINKIFYDLLMPFVYRDLAAPIPIAAVSAETEAMPGHVLFATLRSNSRLSSYVHSVILHDPWKCRGWSSEMSTDASSDSATFTVEVISLLPNLRNLELNTELTGLESIAPLLRNLSFFETLTFACREPTHEDTLDDNPLSELEKLTAHLPLDHLIIEGAEFPVETVEGLAILGEYSPSDAAFAPPRMRDRGGLGPAGAFTGLTLKNCKILSRDLNLLLQACAGRLQRLNLDHTHIGKCSNQVDRTCLSPAIALRHLRISGSGLISSIHSMNVIYPPRCSSLVLHCPYLGFWDMQFLTAWLSTVLLDASYRQQLDSIILESDYELSTSYWEIQLQAALRAAAGCDDLCKRMNIRQSPACGFEQVVKDIASNGFKT